MKSLIADCGSTKCDWAVIDILDATVVKQLQTTGFNAAVTPREEICRILDGELMPNIDAESIDSIHFYGAGCIGGEVNRSLHHMLCGRFDNAPTEIAGDMLGAARALLGDSAGIACILGTGSNSCLYDGREIIANTSPLGYILGDEGSGASLGRRLLNAVFKGLLPAGLIDDFQKRYNLSREELIRRTYREPSANRFLASFCPFLSEHIDEAEIRTLLLDEFTAFITHNLTPYLPAIAALPSPAAIGFVGSIAHHFAPVITDLLSSSAVLLPEASTPKILRSPLSALIDYHIAHF